MKDESALRDALESIVEQFAICTHHEGKRAYSTGGLWALEEAFEVLGWDDPHVVEHGGCDIKDCIEWATCVGAYPRSQANASVSPAAAGFGFLCSKHFHQWNGHEAEPADDLGRLPKQEAMASE